MHIGFLSLAAYHFLTPNTLVNTFRNRDEASKMSDLGADHFLIVRRFEVVDETFDHLIFHHGGLPLVQLALATTGHILEKILQSSSLFS